MHHARRRRTLAGVTVSVLLAVTMSACGGGSGGADDSDDVVQVVASTNVWASVVSAVGGDHVTVTAIIDDPAADPHSFQAGAADAAEVASAELLVWNGGGYDDFFPRLAENADAPAVVAVDQLDDDASGADHSDHAGHDHGNEHVWYDLAAVSAVADQVAAELADLLPQQKQTFEDNAAEFTDALDTLRADLADVAERHGGATVAATEPIAAHLITEAGLTDVTPHDFAAAVENETDVPVAAQQRMLTLVEEKVDAVVRNAQTATPATEKVVEAARQAGTPVVEVTETLPEGQTDYLAWMTGQVEALAKALDA
ncbi:metal ABC transporter solute-binding protein, Zn/Mn family [Saccharomonospora sp. NB11]|uniref:metal ABC transporter solute-binding protein, Zn/Mn family n=1 Tax=Saccharomonospora sp. NB11 TaxID=1642298 RepID=UPI0018D11A3D